jgi:hypothetical protein
MNEMVGPITNQWFMEVYVLMMLTKAVEVVVM